MAKFLGFFGKIVDDEFFDRKSRNECVPTILTRRDASFWRGPVAYWSGFSRVLVGCRRFWFFWIFDEMEAAC